MTRIVDLESIRKMVSSLDLIPLIEEGFVAYSSGNSVVPPVGEYNIRKVAVLEGHDYSNHQNVDPPGKPLQDWLMQLPVQTGVFAITDALGVAPGSACRFINRKIPDELALLGVSNNELLCNLEHPPLSSIRLPGKRLGFEAAKRLNAMMIGNTRNLESTR